MVAASNFAKDANQKICFANFERILKLVANFLIDSLIILYRLEPRDPLSNRGMCAKYPSEPRLRERIDDVQGGQYWLCGGALALNGMTELIQLL